MRREGIMRILNALGSFILICSIAFLIFAGFRICRDYEKGLMDHVEQKLEDRKDRDRIRENYNYHIRMEGRK